MNVRFFSLRFWPTLLLLFCLGAVVYWSASPIKRYALDWVEQFYGLEQLDGTIKALGFRQLILENMVLKAPDNISVHIKQAIISYELADFLKQKIASVHLKQVVYQNDQLATDRTLAIAKTFLQRYLNAYQASDPSHRFSLAHFEINGFKLQSVLASQPVTLTLSAQLEQQADATERYTLLTQMQVDSTLASAHLALQGDLVIKDHLQVDLSLTPDTSEHSAEIASLSLKQLSGSLQAGLSTSLKPFLNAQLNTHLSHDKSRLNLPLQLSLQYTPEQFNLTAQADKINTKTVRIKKLQGHWTIPLSALSGQALFAKGLPYVLLKTLKGSVSAQGVEFPEQGIRLSSPSLQFNPESSLPNADKATFLTALLTTQGIFYDAPEQKNKGLFKQALKLSMAFKPGKKKNTSHLTARLQDTKKTLPIHINGIINHSLLSFSGQFDSNIHLTKKHTQYWQQTSDFFPKLINLPSGQVSIQGHVFISRQNRRADMVLTLADITLEHPMAKMSRINGKIDFDSLFPLRTHPFQKITIDSITAGIKIHTASAIFAIKPSRKYGLPQLLLDQAKANWAGGKISVNKTVLNTTTLAIDPVMVQVSDIDIRQLLTMTTISNLSGQGKINGTIPLHFKDSTLRVNNAHFEATHGKILYHSEIAAQALKQSDQSATLPMLLMENFHFDQLSAQVNGDLNHEMQIKLALSGKNPQQLNGRQINFNLNLTGIVPTVLYQTFRIEQQLRKRLLQQH